MINLLRFQKTPKNSGGGKSPNLSAGIPTHLLQGRLRVELFLGPRVAFAEKKTPMPRRRRLPPSPCPRNTNTVFIYFLHSFGFGKICGFLPFFVFLCFSHNNFWTLLKKLLTVKNSSFWPRFPPQPQKFYQFFCYFCIMQWQYEIWAAWGRVAPPPPNPGGAPSHHVPSPNRTPSTPLEIVDRNLKKKSAPLGGVFRAG